MLMVVSLMAVGYYSYQYFHKPKDLDIPLITVIPQSNNNLATKEIIQEDPMGPYSFCLSVEYSNYIVCYKKYGERAKKLDDGRTHIEELYQGDVIPSGG